MARKTKNVSSTLVAAEVAQDQRRQGAEAAKVQAYDALADATRVSEDAAAKGAALNAAVAILTDVGL